MALSRPLLALVAVSTVAGFVCPLLGAAPRPLVQSLSGPRNASGDLIIDEAHGRFGPLRLGMSLAAAKKALPAADYWFSSYPGGDAWYCDNLRHNRCRNGAGIQLWIVGACEVSFGREPDACLDPRANAPGPVSAIDFRGGEPPSRESRAVVTLRGIRLGSPATSIQRKYRISEEARPCGQAVPTIAGTTYVILAGSITLALTTYHGVVADISLIAGRHPDLCKA